MHDSDTYQAILEEGEVRGVRWAILRLGRQRFSAPADESLKTLQDINDLERLELISDRVLDVSTWQDLLATLDACLPA